MLVNHKRAGKNTGNGEKVEHTISNVIIAGEEVGKNARRKLVENVESDEQAERLAEDDAIVDPPAKTTRYSEEAKASYLRKISDLMKEKHHLSKEAAYEQVSLEGGPSIRSLKQWAADATRDKPKVDKRRADPEFDKDVLVNLAYHAVTTVCEGPVDVKRITDETKKAKIVSMMYSYDCIALAARETQATDKWANNAAVKALKFSSPWCNRFSSQNLFNKHTNASEQSDKLHHLDANTRAVVSLCKEMKSK